MGAKTWMLVYSDGHVRETLGAKPVLDRDATRRFAQELFPSEKLEPLPDGSLAHTNPPNEEITIGCFGNVKVVAAEEFGIDYPSQLPDRFLQAGGKGTIHFHAMHSVVDWAAFAVWREGKLVRSLSLSPDSGVLEDIGPRLPFEQPYWAGEHPAISPEEAEEGIDYPFCFHPLELGEAALNDFFGYQLEGFITPDLIEPEDIPLMRFRRPASALAQGGVRSTWDISAVLEFFGMRSKGK